jgi:DNA-binding NarL/FixJ family response regulator
MSTEEIKCVVLADRHHTLSEGIRVLLQHEFQAVVTVSDELSLLESALRMQPSIVIADLALTRGDCFGWLRRLLARCPESRVIVLSPYDEPSVKREAFDAGAAGVVYKYDISSQLVPAVNEVLAGGRYESPVPVRHAAEPQNGKDHTESE